MDLLHDFIEGVLAYVIFALVKYFVQVKGYFDLHFLNEKISNLKFGQEESYNKPSPILESRLNETTFKMSASETLTLFYFFGICVGDKVPEDDVHWKLYKKLRKILDILMSPHILRSDVNTLEKLVHKHHQLYIRLFGSLTIKFHNLIHYSKLLQQNGPAVHFWTMRFEGYHRKLKLHTAAPSGSVNLKMTIATKECLKMCEMFNELESEESLILVLKLQMKHYFSQLLKNLILITL